MTEDPNKEKKSDQLKRGWEAIWEYRIEILSGFLVLVGIILSFYYVKIGGALVGLGFGICFFEEMHRYFIQLRDVYIEHGVFKTVILIGAVVFFLIAIPSFVIATAIGYGAIYIINKFVKKS